MNLSSANAFSLDQSKIVSFGQEITLYHTMLTFDAHEEKPFEKPFENILGKGENAANQYSLLFTQCFLSQEKPFENIMGKGENAGHERQIFFFE